MTQQLDLLAEEATRDTILNQFKGTHEAALGAIRERLLIRARFGNIVSGNDAREICEFLGIPIGPFLGAVFATKEWEMAGTIKSTGKGLHASRICTWRLKDG